MVSGHFLVISTLAGPTSTTTNKEYYKTCKVIEGVICNMSEVYYLGEHK